MLDLLPVQEIQSLGRFIEVGDQLLERDAVVSFLAAFLEPAAQAAVRQLHDDVKSIFRDKICLSRQ